MSSRYLAAAAIMARAESLTDDGGWPSAQLIEPAAAALAEAVRDHFQNDMGGFLVSDVDAQDAPRWRHVDAAMSAQCSFEGRERTRFCGRGSLGPRSRHIGVRKVGVRERVDGWRQRAIWKSSMSR